MKKRIIIICIILISLTVTALVYYAFYNPFLHMKLNGNSNVSIEVKSSYKEKGVTIKGTKKKAKIISNLNVNKLGKYTIIYKINVLKTNKVVKRVVNVIDTTKPNITLVKGDVSIYQNEEYKEPGYNASDDYDGDITDKVQVESKLDNKRVGEYVIDYKVSDSSKNTICVQRKVIVKEKKLKSNGITYIKGILLVNKKYSLPSDYNPGVNKEAYNALVNLQASAMNNGYSILLRSGFRTYQNQKNLYNYYVSIDGEAVASTYSAKPGESEHQTGLAFDVGEISDSYGSTSSGIWLANNCHLFGFIIRYPQNKSHITGYKYEPWHIRYVGVKEASDIYQSKITLEEYLGVA